jgi:hypothetical protein
MSYENTDCPCGGRKDPGTMLCASCVEFLADDPSYRSAMDQDANVIIRRQCAIAVIARVRNRRRRAGR